jgi:hypothetical protein
MKYECIEHSGHVYDDEADNFDYSVCPFCFGRGKPRVKAVKKHKNFIPYTFKRVEYESPTKDGSGGKIPRRQGSE